MARQRGLWRLYSLLDVAAEGAKSEDFGKLAVRLSNAQRRGLSLPDTWVLPAVAFREAIEDLLPAGHDPATLIRSIHKAQGIERAARARERLLATPPSDELVAVFTELVAEGNGGPWGFAAHASCTLADDTLTESAGLSGARFVLRTPEELARGAIELWADAFDEYALNELRSLRVRDFALAVVVRRLDETLAHGTLVTEDPARLWRWSGQDGEPELAEPERRAVSVAYGLSRSADARDTLLVGVDGGVIAQRLAVKRLEATVLDDKLGVFPVDDERAAQPALSEAARERLLAQADRLGARRPAALDFEVTSRDRVRVVAVRELTGLGFPPGGDAHTVWSRSGLDAFLPAVPTPLTRSLLERFSELSLRNAIRELGGKMPRGVSLVQSVRGRLYFNLSALLPVVTSMPGVDPGSLLELVRGAAHEEIATALSVRRKAASIAALSLAAARLVSRQRRSEEAVQSWERESEQQRRWLTEMDLAILPDDSLKTTLREAHAAFRESAGLLLGLTLSSLAVHLVLRALLGRVRPNDASQIAQRLAAGAGELVTCEPGLAFSHVIEIVRKDPGALEATLAGAAAVEALPEGSGRRALQQWLDAYGEHGVSESELYRPRWREQPEVVLSMLARALEADTEDSEQRLSLVRVDVDRDLASLEANLSYFEATLLRGLITRNRNLLRLRERMRSGLARTMAVIRRVVLDVDRRLRRLDPSTFEGAAFFFSLGELSSAVGHLRADLGPVARWRRAGWEHLCGEPDPPEIFVGMPPPIGPFIEPTLRGEAASPGLVSGAARIVDLDDLARRMPRPGEILVLRSLDVGLSPLMLRAAGLIAECGGTLSHGAVLARELGLPAVVGVPGARSLLKDGEMIHLDGDAGVVERATS